MTTQFLHGVEVVEIQDGTRPIRTVRTGVIGLVGTAPTGPLNTPTLIAGNRTEAVRLFGRGYGTLPDALEAIFEQTGAVVVAVNVLDPEADVVPVAQRAYRVSGDTWTLGDQYARDVEVRTTADGDLVVAAGNYTVDAAAGTVTRVSGGVLDAVTTLYIAYDRIQDETQTIRIEEDDEQVALPALDPVALDHPEGVADVVVRSAADGGGTEYVAGTDYALVVTAPITGVPGSATIAALEVDVTGQAETFAAGNDQTQSLGHTNVKDVVVRSAMSGGTTFRNPEDYTVDLAAGEITRTNTGSPNIGATDTVYVDYTYRPIPAAGTVYVTYTWGQQRGVPDSEIVGGPQTDGSLTGIAALIGAEAVVGVAPKILAAPGRSDSQAVANALISAADRLRAVAVIDAPGNTDADAIAYRGNFGSPRAYLVAPGVKVTDADDETVDRPASAYVAGVIARSDAERGFWWSPSNRLINGILGTSREIDFALGDASARANLLNEQSVATIIRQTGFRLWGNRTCSADEKWAFLSVVRIADALNDSLLRAHLWAVDRNITRTYLTDVAESVNAYIAELVGLGALLGGRCYPTPDLNTPTTYRDGKVFFDFDFNPVYPAERITFRSRLVDDYIEEIFT